MDGGYKSRSQRPLHVLHAKAPTADTTHDVAVSGHTTQGEKEGFHAPDFSSVTERYVLGVVRL